MQFHQKRNPRRGHALITVVIFIAIISTMLAGVSTFAVSHHTRARSDADWLKALTIAEAGVNTELAKISRNFLDADQYPGTTYQFAGGSYKVWVMQRDPVTGAESSPWNAPRKLTVYSEGVFNGVKRTLRVAIKSVNVRNNYTLYAMQTGTLNGTVTINGNVGTNGSLSSAGTVNITHGVELNGASATYSGSAAVTRNPAPLLWQTVDEIANEMFPQGGLTWLATHNDNARVGLPTDPLAARINNSITLIGPGNYYVSDIQMTGTKKVTFDNRNGTVNLWVGPPGYGLEKFAGATMAVPTGQPGSYDANLFCVKEGLELVGTSTFHGNIYCYNKYGNIPYGTITNSGTPRIVGTVLANVANVGGTSTITFDAPASMESYVGYYGFDNFWGEGVLKNGQFVEKQRNSEGWTTGVTQP